MKLEYATEAALTAAAGQAARCWQAASLARLLVGLTGELGVGKTAWVRAMLEGLGYAGRVPSPTYTLLEHYRIGTLTVVHLDLYRLAEPSELEYLGIRDWLGGEPVWLMIEWPERSPQLRATLDLTLALDVAADDARLMRPESHSAAGQSALAAWLGQDIK